MPAHVLSEQALINRALAAERRIARAAINGIIAARRATGTLQQLSSLIEQGRIEEAVQASAAAGAIDVNQASASVYVQSGQRTAKWIGQALAVTIDFDQTHTRAVEVMQASRLQFIREWTETQRSVARSVMTRGITEGLNPIEQAREFRNGTGLTAFQNRIVNNYGRTLRRVHEMDAESASNMLREGRKLRDARFDRTVIRAAKDGKPLTSVQINKMTQRYRERMIKRRAETIARTEALSAVHTANHEAFSQAIDNGAVNPNHVVRTWVSARDQRVRRDHVNANRQQRGPQDPFDVGGAALLHPGDPNAPAKQRINCRCSLTVRITDDGSDPFQPPPATRIIGDSSRIRPPPATRPKPATRRAATRKPAVTGPKTFAQLDRFKTSRTPKEKSYHKLAWGNATESIRRAAARTPGLNKIFSAIKEGAHYNVAGRRGAGGPTINMAEFKAEPGKLHSQGVWRHEFGHHMDYMAGSKMRGHVGSRSPIPASTMDEFTDAMKEDVAKMKLGRDHTGTTFLAQQTAALTRAFNNRPSTVRRRQLKKLFEEAGLDETEVRDFLTREGPLGEFDGVRGSKHQIVNPDIHDSIVHRFLTAYLRKEPQGMLDVLSLNKPQVVSLLPIDETVRVVRSGLMRERSYTFMLSDLFDALTEQRASNGASHSSAYYAARPLGRNKEVFANMVACMGESAFGEKLVRHFMPEVSKRMDLAFEAVDSVVLRGGNVIAKRIYI